MMEYQLATNAGIYTQIFEDFSEDGEGSGSPAPERRAVRAPGKASTHWNERFRAVLMEASEEERYAKLCKLAKDFVYVAKLYAKIIISERSLDETERTIKSEEIGGIAGGEKYICQGILFKFALDIQNIYGGDEYAMKAAGHELKGLMCYYNCHIPELNVPLMALIDYKGFRMVAISLLPVDKETIIYGSNDGGVTVHSKVPQFNRLMKLAGRKLNLKEHIAGKEESATVYSPADIEGHLGKDGCFYLLDFARTMPPEVPLISDKLRRPLFQLLRPELLKLLKNPLSSDAFLMMGQVDPNQEIHIQEVKEACEHLYNHIIPQFAQCIVSPPEEYLQTPSQPHLLTLFDSLQDNLDIVEVIQRVHRAGINIRHLGLVRSHSTNEKVKSLLINEIVARVLKEKLRKKARKQLSISKTLSDEPYREVIANFLNDKFVIHRLVYWREKIKESINFKFPKALCEAELETNFNIIEILNIQNVIKRLGELTGFVMTEGSSIVLAFGSSTIVDSDLLEMDAKVKGMNIVSEATAMVLKHQASQRNGSEANRLYQLAIDNFKKSISTSPNSALAFFEFGKMMHQIALKEPDGDNAIFNFTTALDKLHSSENIDKTNWEVSLEIADTLLDFIVYPRRLWLIYRKDNKKYLESLSTCIENAGNRISNVLKPVFQTSRDHDDGQHEKLMVEKITLMAQNSSDIKLLCLLEMSLNVKPLRPIVKNILKGKVSFIVDSEGVVFFKKETLFSLCDIAVNLQHLTLSHAIQLDSSFLHHAFKKLTALKSLSLANISSITGVIFPTTLEVLDINGTRISLLPPPKVSSPNILTKSLSISGGNPSPAGPSMEFPFPTSITTLNLDGTDVNDQQLFMITTNLTSLWKLSLAKFNDHLRNSHYCMNISTPNIVGTALGFLDLSGCINLRNGALSYLSKSTTNLVSLSLGKCCNVSDDGVLPLLKKLTKLAYLDLSTTSVTDASFKNLGSSNPMISTMLLSLCSQIKGTIFKTIMLDCNNLKVLNLDFCKIDTEILTKIKIKSKKDSDKSLLEEFSNSSWEGASDKTIEILLSKFQNIKTLNLGGCLNLSNMGLGIIGRSLTHKLKSLDIRGCPLINKEGIEELCKYSNQLTTLILDQCNDINGAALNIVADNLKSLTILGLSGLTKITENDLQYLLLRCTDLQQLDISSCSGVKPNSIVKLRYQCKNFTFRLSENMKYPLFQF